MIRTIRISGFGGQGVMLTGQLLAHAANEQGLYSLWVPTYGPETRGGTANCSITISDKPIYSPVFQKSDDLLIFNEPSLAKFGEKIKSGGNIFYNSSLIKKKVNHDDRNVYPVPMSELAQSLDKPQVANMVMLGAYLNKVGIFKEEVIIESLKYFLGPKKANMLEINQKAIAIGFESVN
ncbi:2-oxoacid:acceptor oxidoreductase family protein [Peloplasma aerotolerans]|jgi:2-oxoglutarate ferredoxin oxidoreductase subunit gamma|uniref:2-oxoacid:acceptor oxidoreductase family protein n=1 Tax=Peloplasma aerotolerans TaxID=3044389 RepID=A0AAW6U6X4_9MOLU|nr:2-oxoacid:acceptor oxidoreductase family protein [Mariniplasma sp. M4Ah]MDI6453585.1 2-oxoacid:acceptor oxidoreductase family protein [Mariniplasma sp. M4Ah]